MDPPQTCGTNERPAAGRSVGMRRLELAGFGHYIKTIQTCLFRCYVQVCIVVKLEMENGEKRCNGNIRRAGDRA